MTDTAPPLPTDLRNTLEEMRASVAAEGARKGLTGALQEAILKLLEVIIKLLMDFRAGKFASLAAVAEAAPRSVELCATDAGSEGNDVSATVRRSPARTVTAEDTENRRGVTLFSPSSPLEQAGDERGGADDGELVGGLQAERTILCAPSRSKIFTAESAERRRGIPTASASRDRWRNTPGFRRDLPPCKRISKNRRTGASDTRDQIVTIS